MLAQLLKQVGEPYDKERHEADFGLESAERVADFYNNGGLELHNNNLNMAIQYVALVDGRVEIGAWAWYDGDDFDADADFEVNYEDVFTEEELQRIHDAIKAIYE